MARVLVVDDEPDILLLHRLNLEHAGHVVLLAADGVTALNRIRDDEPEVVVLDVMMPALDGWGVLDELKRQPNPPRVVVVSAYPSNENVDRALTSGASAFLAKPFVAEALLDIVAELAKAS